MKIEKNECARVLTALLDGSLSKEEALQQLTEVGGADLGYARIDHQREARCGFPEVVYGAGKTDEQLLGIAQHFAERKRNFFATRIAVSGADVICKAFAKATHDPLARTVTMLSTEVPTRSGDVAVVCAGTSDLPMAGECVNTLSFFGFQPRLVTDVGVAGIHRLLTRREEIENADVVIVIAGMEGALPSVVAGLVSTPLIAVPTSVGYGAGLNGLAPLLGMLNSCASGVTVVNIDNGFGAACAALRILRQKTP